MTYTDTHLATLGDVGRCAAGSFAPSGANSSHVVQDGQRSIRSVPHTSTLLLLVGLLAVAFVVGGFGTYAFLRYRAPRAQAAVGVGSARVTSAAVVVETSVPVEALPAPVAPKTTTLLTFAPSRFGHRVWIDGVLVGEDKKPIETKCGRHTIKVGSQGKAREVDLPCGGETKL